MARSFELLGALHKLATASTSAIRYDALWSRTTAESSLYYIAGRSFKACSWSLAPKDSPSNSEGVERNTYES